MTRVVIENASYLVTVDEADTVLRNATVVVEDGAIRDIGQAGGEATHGPKSAAQARPSLRPLAGPGGSATERQRGSADGLRPHDGSAGADDDPDGRPSDDAPGADGDPDQHLSDRRPATGDPEDVTVIDARGKLLMPGLVNLHTHLPMTLLRGLAENVDLQGFLTRVWAAEAAVMDPATVELGATLGAVESLLGGCTTQLDMYFHHEAAHRGAVRAGSRHVIGPVFFDGPGPDGLTWEERLDNLRGWPALLDAIGGPEVPVAAMPHATYTCSPQGLTEVVGALRRLLAGSDRSGLLSTHVSENAAENAGIRDRYDATPTELLHRAGWISPDLPLVLGHGVHLSAGDLALLAEGATTVAHAPGSNMKLASGALQWERQRASGIRVGLGTDGPSSSNDLDMWQVMRQAALLARLTSGRADVASATDVLRAATIEGAEALGLGALIGSVEVGKRADLVLLDLEAAHLVPVHDVEALLVFAAGRGDVTDVLVDGVPVVRHRLSTRVDMPALLAGARDRGEDAWAAAGRR